MRVSSFCYEFPSMKSKAPFAILSDSYVDAERVLDDKFEELDPLVKRLLSSKPSMQGTYKKVFPRMSDNSVLVLEIGGAVFKTARQRLFDALSNFDNRHGLLVPTQLLEYEFVVNLEPVYLLVSELSRCPVDLQMAFDGETSAHLSMSYDFLIKEMFKLSGIIFHLANDGLFFTDIKTENVLHCGDDLALIDLDSILMEEDIVDGIVGAISYPPARMFKALYNLFSSEAAVNEDEQNELLFEFYRFYTVFAFSSMVFQLYWAKHKNVDVLIEPSQMLPSEKELEAALSKHFPSYSEGNKSKHTILTLSWKMLKLVFSGPTLQEAREEIFLWNTPMNREINKQIRKEEKASARREKLNKIKRTSSKLLF